MKFKTLRRKDTQEFAEITPIAGTNKPMVFTSELPSFLADTATMEAFKDYWLHYYPECNINFDDYEIVEYEMYEVNTIGADIRNKLSPSKTLVELLEEYFSVKIAHASEERAELVKLIKKEMKQTKINIKYIANLF